MQSIVSPPNSLPSMHDRKTAFWSCEFEPLSLAPGCAGTPSAASTKDPLLSVRCLFCLFRGAICRTAQSWSQTVTFEFFSTFQLVAHLSASFYMQVHRRITTTWLLKLIDNISEAQPIANSTRPPCFVDLVFSIATPLSARTGLTSPFLQLILTLSLK